ncbi:hypothetical protein GCM10027072_03110 [Streptomyces bullii]
MRLRLLLEPQSWGSVTAAAVVADPGPVLVAAAPAGPVQDVFGAVPDGVRKRGKQAADLVHAQSD